MTNTKKRNSRSLNLGSSASGTDVKSETSVCSEFETSKGVDISQEIASHIARSKEQRSAVALPASASASSSSSRGPAFHRAGSRDTPDNSAYFRGVVSQEDATHRKHTFQRTSTEPAGGEPRDVFQATASESPSGRGGAADRPSSPAPFGYGNSATRGTTGRERLGAKRWQGVGVRTTTHPALFRAASPASPGASPSRRPPLSNAPSALAALQSAEPADVPLKIISPRRGKNDPRSTAQGVSVALRRARHRQGMFLIAGEDDSDIEEANFLDSPKRSRSQEKRSEKEKLHRALSARSAGSDDTQRRRVFDEQTGRKLQPMDELKRSGSFAVSEATKTVGREPSRLQAFEAAPERYSSAAGAASATSSSAISAGDGMRALVRGLEGERGGGDEAAGLLASMQQTSSASGDPLFSPSKRSPLDRKRTRRKKRNRRVLQMRTIT